MCKGWTASSEAVTWNYNNYNNFYKEFSLQIAYN